MQERIYRLKVGLHLRKVGQEALVMPVRQRVADMDHLFSLNETGTLLWEKLAEGATHAELTRALQEAYEVSEEEASVDVNRFLEEAKELITHE